MDECSLPCNRHCRNRAANTARSVLVWQKKTFKTNPAKPVKGTVGVKDPWERILHHSPIAEGMSLTSLPFAVSRITTCSPKSCWDIARQFSEAMMEGKEGLVDSRLA